MSTLPNLIAIEVATDRQILMQLHHLLIYTHERLAMSQQAIDALTAQVTRLTTVDASAVALLQGLKSSLDAAIASAPTDDSAALNDLSAKLGTSTDALAAAVAANTPAAATTPTAAPTGNAPTA